LCHSLRDLYKYTEQIVDTKDSDQQKQYVNDLLRIKNIFQKYNYDNQFNNLPTTIHNTINDSNKEHATIEKFFQQYTNDYIKWIDMKLIYLITYSLKEQIEQLLTNKQVHMHTQQKNITKFTIDLFTQIVNCKSDSNYASVQQQIETLKEELNHLPIEILQQILAQYAYCSKDQCTKMYNKILNYLQQQIMSYKRLISEGNNIIINDIKSEIKDYWRLYKELEKRFTNDINNKVDQISRAPNYQLEPFQQIDENREDQSQPLPQVRENLFTQQNRIVSDDRSLSMPNSANQSNNPQLDHLYDQLNGSKKNYFNIILIIVTILCIISVILVD
jgi:ElaB/YqjD/DUF883 family membrane-anchored ribosome-binding protein